MIAIVSGLPGSGKTLSALKRFIIPAIKEGRQIYTNIEGIDLLGLSLYTEFPYEKAQKNLIAHELQDEKDIKTNQPLEPFKFSTKRMLEGIALNSLVVIDEAQVFWNNRDYASEENKRLLPFLQKHRHYGIDIIFLTQNIDQLDIGIRRLAQVHYRLRRMTNSGLSKVVKVDIYPDAMGSEQFKPMATNLWTIDKAIFKFYDSYQGNASETKSPVGNIILKNPRIIFAVVAILVFGLVVLRNFSNHSLGEMMTGQTVKKDFSKFNLGDYDEYYCGDRFYVLRAGGITDTLPKGTVPPSYCPSLNFHFKRVTK
jgi:zona occludens toxin (predicted ATPase)